MTISRPPALTRRYRPSTHAHLECRGQADHPRRAYDAAPERGRACGAVQEDLAGGQSFDFEEGVSKKSGTLGRREAGKAEEGREVEEQGLPFALAHAALGKVDEQVAAGDGDGTSNVNFIIVE
jgi:hypothetical protein